jgi:hypothetical protein
MQKLVNTFFLTAFLVCLVFLNCGTNDFNNSLTFIAAADWRYFSLEEYRNSAQFLGAVQKMKEVGAGSFMISPGDVDPPHAAREVLSQVLGEDYPWYPVVGNHELDEESSIEWLRQYNKDGTTLPNIVRQGPPGCEETTFSFDWENCHFVALNQYYDGKIDDGTDGDMVPELLAWLEKDLAATKKKHIFIIGHEPIVAIPDMDNGRIRHQGDSLDKYAINTFRFHQLMLKHNVKAYFCGHTHNTSYANINGVWQIDVGHARGIEDNWSPSTLFELLQKFVIERTKENISENQALTEYFQKNKKVVKKANYYLKLASAASYKKIPDEVALKGLKQFYYDFKAGGEKRENHLKTFWEFVDWSRSGFIKVFVGKEKVKLDIYRDDARGGSYSLRHSVILD